MKVLVTGSRNWTDEDATRQELEKLDPYKDIVIHGGCRGADMIADRIAKSLGVHTARVDALWNWYPHTAGPVQNSIMLDLEPDNILAFPLPGSKGTLDMLKQAKQINVPIKQIGSHVLLLH